MSEQPPKKGGNKPEVVQLAAMKCAEETCREKPVRHGFCNNHYDWFKHGLITKMGTKPKDFDKKFRLYMRKQTKAA